MNKTTTLTLALTFFALSAGAKNLEFRFQGKALANGDTITLQAVEDVTGGITAGSNENGNSLMLANISGMAIKADGTLYVLDNPDLVDLQWCVGTNCTPTVTKTISKTAYFSKDEQIKMMYDARFAKEGNVLVLFVFNYKKGTELDSLYIRSVYSTSAVRSATAAPHMSLSGRQLSYSFSGNGNRTLKVYSLEGQLMTKHTLGLQGSIALSDLPKGTYICDVTEKNKHIITRKILVE
jgi:hypothetical protein